MSNIKTVISVLCKHINFLFSLELRPEVFRLAKFNKNEENVVEVFWSVLSKFADCSSSNDVKTYMKKIGYRRPLFYELREDTPAVQELLLALGFILSIGELDKIVERKCRESLFHVDNDLVMNKIGDVTFSSNISKSELTEAIKWIKGKTHYYKRTANEYGFSINSVLKRLDELSTFSFNLTLPELKALNDKGYAKHFLNGAKWIIQVLDNHDQWLKKEAVFWEWMDSVIMEKRKRK